MVRVVETEIVKVFNYDNNLDSSLCSKTFGIQGCGIDGMSTQILQAFGLFSLYGINSVFCTNLFCVLQPAFPKSFYTRQYFEALVQAEFGPPFLFYNFLGIV